MHVLSINGNLPVERFYKEIGWFITDATYHKTISKIFRRVEFQTKNERTTTVTLLLFASRLSLLTDVNKLKFITQAFFCPYFDKKASRDMGIMPMRE